MTSVPPDADPASPAPARLYDYFLGGGASLEVDRAAAEQLRAVMPELSDAAWANYGFHRRAARWMAEQGIRQFIDIGSGLPTHGSTHETLARVSPGIRVVYADRDQTVAAHARDQLADIPSARFVRGSVRDPGGLLGSPEVRELIDLTRPVGLMMTAILHFVADEEDPWGLVRTYLAALAPGSYVAISHITTDRLPPRLVAAGLELYRKAGHPLHPRGHDEVARFFAGLELVGASGGDDPSVGYVGAWGAEDPEAADSDGSRIMYCGVARLP